MRSASRLAAVALTVALAACSTARPAPAPTSPLPPAVKDRDLGLSRTSVFDVPTPPAFTAETSAPGEKPLPPRLSSEIPPVIPHGVTDFLPISQKQNSCVDCHQVEGPKKAGEPTPIPASHVRDLWRAPDLRAAQVVGARWICTACHVARTDAPPAVANGFLP